MLEMVVFGKKFLVVLLLVMPIPQIKYLQEPPPEQELIIPLLWIPIIPQDYHLVYNDKMKEMVYNKLEDEFISFGYIK